MWPLKDSIKFPDKGWARRVLGGKYDYTPDIVKLENLEGHLVLIHDDLKFEHRRHSLVQYADMLAFDAYTADNFSMWTVRMGKDSYPIAMKQKSFVPHCVVHGELYFVDTATLVSLDRYRQNGVIFQRERVPIRVPYVKAWIDGNLEPRQTNILYETMDCWMYTAVPSYWNDRIDGGILFSKTSIHHFAPNKHDLGDKGRFYRFSAEDYFGGDGLKWIEGQQLANQKIKELEVRREGVIEELREYGRELDEKRLKAV